MCHISTYIHMYMHTLMHSCVRTCTRGMFSKSFAKIASLCTACMHVCRVLPIAFIWYACTMCICFNVNTIELFLDALKHIEDVCGGGSVLSQISSPSCDYTTALHAPSFSDSDDESQMHCKKLRLQEECQEGSIICTTYSEQLTDDEKWCTEWTFTVLNQILHLMWGLQSYVVCAHSASIPIQPCYWLMYCM